MFLPAVVVSLGALSSSVFLIFLILFVFHILLFYHLFLLKLGKEVILSLLYKSFSFFELPIEDIIPALLNFLILPFNFGEAIYVWPLQVV